MPGQEGTVRGGVLQHAQPLPHNTRPRGTPLLTALELLRSQNETKIPPGVWGTHRPPATVCPDADEVNKILAQSNLRYPDLSLSPIVVDKPRRQGVDDFYYACQLFRDQYKDNTGKLHPLDYFQDSEIIWQCPPNMTTAYIKQPVCYPRYLKPPVLARSLPHSEEWPSLATQSLAGKAYRHHDTVYL
ncbi:Uncharacterized protein GBIM_18226, partial [Gryllus bimaculatus]